MNAEKALENLSRNGFDAKYFGTAAQAADYLAAQLHGKTIGFGGSVTLDTMGLYDRLSADNTLFWHWKQPADEARAAAAHAQVYLTSANAISETGEIVNETKGQTYHAAAFPPFIQGIIEAGGLLKSLKARGLAE